MTTTPGDRGAEPGGEPGVSVKARDLFWTVFVVDPLAVPLAYRLRHRSWVTADRLTVLSALCALGAAALFATREFAVGAIVYQVGFLLDCMDGKVASYQGKRHDWGGWFDQAGDGFRIAVCSAGMAIGLVEGGDLATWQIMVLVLYPNGRWAVNKLVGSRPRGAPAASAPAVAPSAPRGKFELPGSPWAVLRAAPRRTQRPGSTVDTEAIAFTLGPLSTFPFAGLVVATAVDGAHALKMLAVAVRNARRAARRATPAH